MRCDGRTAVLVAVADRDVRRMAAQALRAAGFEVWEAQDYDEAVTLLHASPRRLVILVGRDLVSVLGFAAADRRMAHHHLYIALDSARAAFGEAECKLFSCLTLWRLPSPTPDELTQRVTKAARLLESDSLGWRELVTR